MSVASFKKDANRKVSNKLTYKALYAYRRRCTYSTNLCGPVRSFAGFLEVLYDYKVTSVPCANWQKSGI